MAEHVPELKEHIKWHLVFTDGPMHYVENAKYWAGRYSQWCKGGVGDPPNEEHFKSTIVYGAIEEGMSAKLLMDLVRGGDYIELAKRLPRLLAELQRAVESLGFTY